MRSGPAEPSGDLVELCPLHEVPAHLRAISKVLQRITVPRAKSCQPAVLILPAHRRFFRRLMRKTGGF